MSWHRHDRQQPLSYFNNLAFFFNLPSQKIGTEPEFSDCKFSE
jgi:hypothetical protein